MQASFTFSFNGPSSFPIKGQDEAIAEMTEESPGERKEAYIHYSASINPREA